MPTTWGSCSSGRMTCMLCPCPSKRRLVHDDLCPFSGLHPANHNSFKTNEEKEKKTSWLQQSMTSHHIKQTGVLKSRRETAAQAHHRRLVSHLQNCPENYLEKDQSPQFIIQLPTICEVLIPVYVLNSLAVVSTMRLCLPPFSIYRKREKEVPTFTTCSVCRLPPAMCSVPACWMPYCIRWMYTFAALHNSI